MYIYIYNQPDLTRRPGGVWPDLLLACWKSLSFSTPLDRSYPGGRGPALPLHCTDPPLSPSTPTPRTCVRYKSTPCPGVLYRPTPVSVYCAGPLQSLCTVQAFPCACVLYRPTPVSVYCTDPLQFLCTVQAYSTTFVLYRPKQAHPCLYHRHGT